MLFAESMRCLGINGLRASCKHSAALLRVFALEEFCRIGFTEEVFVRMFRAGVE